MIPVAFLLAYWIDGPEYSRPQNRKGCDIGYAPAVCSCEEANSVDTCTVAALDAITAFAVPNPNCSSQSQSVFFGFGCSSGHPVEQITQPCRSPKSRLACDPFQSITSEERDWTGL